MPRVFILGAAGFVGSEVVAEFKRVGYDVSCLTRSEQKAKELAKQEGTLLVTFS
jgi:uncharacterized protein YbjT (DUF2867 family)